MRLFITEKPSVARDLARVLGLPTSGRGSLGSGDTRIAWCLGHLVELAEPSSYDPAWKRWSWSTLPMLPERFALQPRKDSADQWRVVRDLLRDPALTEVVNACDAGREGELIFAYVYQLSGCRKPVRRLWVSSMTDAALRKGLDQLRPGERFRPLEHAARCRSQADWLVGLNATRAMTLEARRHGGGSRVLSLGRVQTPTLTLVAEREQAIEDFEPQPFWQVQVTFEARGGTWKANWFRLDEKRRRRDRIQDRKQARAILERVRTADRGEVILARPKESRERPPHLYDLTALQKEANRRFGLSASRTLELAQALYERHKVLTYPRTDSRFLTRDQQATFPDLLRTLDFGPYREAAAHALDRCDRPLGDRFVNDEEVGDHHAILPTPVDPRERSLSAPEKRIYDLVVRRFLAAFHPPARFAVLSVETLVTDGEHRDLFFARGRACLDPGWQRIDPPHKRKADRILPPVERGDTPRLAKAGLHEGRTRPPPRYTEATLLGAMETAGKDLDDALLRRAMKRRGLGTPATRANIIETLLSRGFLERQSGKHLAPTARGRALLEALPVQALRSPRLTGQWEARLAAIAEGEEPPERFLADIRAFTRRALEEIQGLELSDSQIQVLSPPERGGEELAPCPRCQEPVREVRFGWRCGGCGLFVPGKVARRQVSRRMARHLLERGETQAVQGFRSREGRTFTAALRLDDEGRVVFHFPAPPSLGSCPVCGTPVRRRKKVFTCDTGRECAFVLSTHLAGREFSDSEIRLLLETGRTSRLHGFRQRSGSVFKAAVVLGADHRLTFDYSPEAEDPPLPPGAPPPALGQRIDCPRCVAARHPRPGYVIAGREAWGCSRWREGCAFRVPFEVAGLRLPDDQARRLFGRHRATRYLKGFTGPAGPDRTHRVVLDPASDTGWRLEARGKPR